MTRKDGSGIDFIKFFCHAIIGFKTIERNSAIVNIQMVMLILFPYHHDNISQTLFLLLIILTVSE
jgi:hypothetical protein